MSNQSILDAISAVKSGKLVAIPTETVYGLSAPFNQLDLVKKIFETKGRPLFDPLIVHVADTEQARSLSSEWHSGVDRLVENFWPGPLTIVLPKSDKVDDLISSGLDTVGIRMPKQDLTLDFIRELGSPIVAPSANLFKKTSPTKAIHVSSIFSEDQVYVLDGGDCSVGIESTIVRVLSESELEILRPGILSSRDFEKLGFTVLKNKVDKINAPGQMKDHYMPETPLILAAVFHDGNIKEHLSKLGFSSFENLDLPNSPFEAARQLYQLLRTQTSKDCLIITLSPSHFNDEKWEAILDRLNKASTHKIF